MQVVFYLDIIFLINFIVGCFVFVITNIILRQRVKWWRICMGAAIGSASLLFFVPGLQLLKPIEGTIIYIGISMGANVICFGYKKRGLLLKWLLSTTIMILIGNGMNYIRYILGLTILDFSKWMLCFFVVGIFVFIGCFQVKKCAQKNRQTYVVKIHHGEHVFLEYLYMDTGNFLWDPLFQKPVVVLSEEVVRTCFTVEENRLLKEYFDTGILNYTSLHSNEMQKKYCFHEISYESVGNPTGRMLCFLMDEVELLDCKITLYRQPVAIAPEMLFRGKMYQGLLQPDCISL